MKKIIKLSMLGVGGALAIAGAGTIGGTYSQYNNYQLIVDAYNTSSEIATPTASLSEYVETMNKQWSLLTPETKESIIKEQNKLKEMYPTFEDYKNYIGSVGIISSSQEKAMRAYYNLETGYNYNYNADQSGVIAGSVLLSIGGVVAIAGGVLYFTDKNKQPKQQTNN